MHLRSTALRPMSPPTASWNMTIAVENSRPSNSLGGGFSEAAACSLVLARSSLYLALAGIWVLASAVIRRPVTISSSKAFAAKSNGQDGIIAVDWLAVNSEPFLRIHRGLSALWGGMFLLYAVVRVAIIYSTSVPRAVSISEIPGIVAIGICLIVSRQAGKRLEALASERLRDSGGSAAC
jgi:hypothetical protein